MSTFNPVRVQWIVGWNNSQVELFSYPKVLILIIVADGSKRLCRNHL